MRRKEKEITDRAELESIIRRSAVCRIAMSEEGQPYIVPVCFGFSHGALFFHSAREGKKIDILKKNNRVCFEFDVPGKVLPGETACRWGMKYSSVIGFGRAVRVRGDDDKQRALDAIMVQYGAEDVPFEYPAPKLESTAVFRVDVDHMTGKRG